jgi:predicted nucleic acid-binding protein
VIADGPPRRVLEVAGEGMIELILPDLVLAELERVMTERLSLGPEQFRRLQVLLDELRATIVETPASADEVSGDPSDDRILAAALTAAADVLVSGDRQHLLPLSEVAGMRIIRPQGLLAELAG